jgi:Fic family protein
MEEAIASSQLEGAATTRKRAREMLLNNERPRDFGERMILNNYRVMQNLRDWQTEPITVDRIVSIQAMLTEGTLQNPAESGTLRQDNEIVVGDEIGRVLYTPPPFEVIPEQLEALCAFANATPEQFEHPVIRAIIIHFWLALVHPFCDGNGRTARALFYLYMLKQGYWPFEFLPVSRVIKGKPAQYQRAYLYAETDDADFTYFLVFNLKAIEQALRDLHSYIARKLKEDTRLSTRLARDFDLNYRQRAVLARALKNPTATFTFKSHRASHGVVYATARKDLFELADRGYLVRERRGREFVFLPAPDLRDHIAAPPSALG